MGTTACVSRIPNRDPVGEAFPSVVGNSLKGEEVALPEAFAGRPVLLLVGYAQKTQFDVDRWLLGLLQTGTRLDVREVPAVEGFVAGLLEETIDQGMRDGIPSEDWGSVVTVYDQSDAVIALTGNTKPRNARVLLLDGAGRVTWFHDRGYSAGVLLEMLRQAKKLDPAL